VLKNKYLLKAFLGFFLASVAIGQNSFAAATSGQFLKIGVGARPEALGGAFTGLSNDVDALLWNPAGLTRVAGTEQTFAHNSWIEDMNVEYLGFAARLGKKSVLGVGLEYVGYGDIPGANKYGDPAGTYSAYDLMGVVSYARQLRKNMSVGISIKSFQEKIQDERASSIAADFGVLYSLERLNLGLAAKNFGGSLKFIDETCPVAQNINFGTAYKISNNLLAAADVQMPSDSDVSIHIGGEYIYKKIRDTNIALRAGYKTNTKGLDSMAGISFGFGAKYKSWAMDYAFAPYGDLGTSHRISIKMKFGGGVFGSRGYDDITSAFGEFNEFVPGSGNAEGVGGTVGAAGTAETNYYGGGNAPTEIIIDRGKAGKSHTNALDMYKEALRWFDEKVDRFALDKYDQLVVLKRIKDKFEPLGVNVSALKERIRKIENE